MNKTKKFLHMIISFAFAFVLAIGGIGIKSAKVAKAGIANNEVVFTGALDDYLREKGYNPGTDTVFLIEKSVVNSVTALPSSAIKNALCQGIPLGNHMNYGWYDQETGECYLSISGEMRDIVELPSNDPFFDDDEHLVVAITDDFYDGMAPMLPPVDFLIGPMPGDPIPIPGLPPGYGTAPYIIGGFTGQVIQDLF